MQVQMIPELMKSILIMGSVIITLVKVILELKLTVQCIHTCYSRMHLNRLMGAVIDKQHQ